VTHKIGPRRQLVRVETTAITGDVVEGVEAAAEAVAVPQLLTEAHLSLSQGPRAKALPRGVLKAAAEAEAAGGADDRSPPIRYW
jgi:hypothetical protein